MIRIWKKGMKRINYIYQFIVKEVKSKNVI